MESSEAATAFAALSQDARLNLMRLLMAEGPTGMAAGELANRLGLPASTTSFHLAALERAGLTQSTRQGRQIIHAARIAGLRRLLGFPHRNLLRRPPRIVRRSRDPSSPMAG